MRIAVPGSRAFDIQAALFDLDGTLVDSLPDFVVALRAMLAEMDLPSIDAAQAAPLLGKGVDHLVRAVLTRSVGDAQADALYPVARPIYWRHYLAANGRHGTVFPGVVNGLNALRAGGVTLAVVTNKPMAFAQPLLEAMALDGYFVRVCGGDTFARMKPDPLPLLAACEALGCAPARALMIGDSSNDSRAARAAGCPVVLMRYGYNHGVPVEDVDCDAVLDRLDDLIAADSTPRRHP
ncbi:phosphoglycolate phosphatase [Caenimonas sedimenti]|uniref:Phosphoglycolate phosphatase n=1 Tax=Caenimonas sedimenti TaxID=2596921 RepID=A0A562ZNL4_9BURK|nr:phosphoglycolate phosphatase [Caenimonas sedimenti]TWO69744.1 phosphoglycolate phosphatase [Caenimonas sedimenti]